jgi:hypothetical protein
VPSIAKAMSRHGGFRWISTPWLFRKGRGTRPAFMVPPRMEASACRQAHQQSNRRRTVETDLFQIQAEILRERRNELATTNFQIKR